MGFFILRNGYIKIGKSFNPTEREKTLQSKEPELSLIFCSPICLEFIEGVFHRLFEAKRVRGEWFALNEEDIQFIKNYNFDSHDKH